MSTRLYRLGRWTAAHRVTVTVIWVLLLLGSIGAMRAFGGHVTDEFSIPGTESQQAADLVAERFPAVSGSSATVVVVGEDLAAAHRETIEELAAALGDIDGVSGVSEPFARGAVAPSGDVLQFQVQFPVDATEVDQETFEAVQEAVQAAATEDLRTELGGQVASAQREQPGPTTEVIGLLVAVFVLIVTFGSFLAMSIPLITALFGIGLAVSLILLAAAGVDVPAVAEILGIMIGLAVGIDYALFIVSRHRGQVLDGMEVHESIGRSLATAGNAVVFAGSTVVIAMLGLLVVGIPFIAVMGMAVAFAVVVAVVIALTLLPAILAFAGPRIAKSTVPGLRGRESTPPEQHLGARWSRWVTRRPWLSFGAGLAIIGLLSVPLLSLDTAMPSDAMAPEDSSRRQAFELIGDAFGPGFNARLLIVVNHAGLDAQQTREALAQIHQRVAADPGVLMVTEPRTNPAGDASIISAIPQTGPTDASTEQLVHRLRTEPLQEAEEATGVTTYVAGPTALTIDIDDQQSSRLPWVIGIVLLLTFLVLMVAFRSVLVPLKAAIGILLSIGAALGVVVAVFQWGWGAEFIGVDSTQPIVSPLPLLAFAILFGLSMDYEVFILSRVREDWLETGDAEGSVVRGVGLTARVITAAASVMIAVFSGFMLGNEPIVKQIGLALASAVLIDATLVRMVLVPSTMVMFDRANWWLPNWLDRILPNVDMEGERTLEELESVK
jgi:RND superfamily putative drug exporter